MKKSIFPLLMLILGQAFTVKAADTDLNTIDNVIYIAPETVEAGKTATLSICMRNTANIRGFQFDLYLPACVTAAKNAKGRYLCSFSNTRLEDDDEHTLTVAEQNDGSIRFLCGSQYDETFTGTDGEIATLTITIADDADGNYPIILKNIKLTETDISKFYETAEVQATLTVVNTALGVNIIVNGKSSDAPIFNTSGQRLFVPRKGVNIIGGKKVVIK